MWVFTGVILNARLERWCKFVVSWNWNVGFFMEKS